MKIISDQFEVKALYFMLIYAHIYNGCERMNNHIFSSSRVFEISSLCCKDYKIPIKATEINASAYIMIVSW